MHRIATAAFLTLAAAPALADYVSLSAEGSVAETADRLVSAAEEAGATIFARVPHSKGAMSVGMELQDAELVIFGNPQLGTPALQSDIRAGLALPLRVLIHADGEVKASQALYDAAVKLSQNPLTIQLRYLQTLSDIAAEQNSTIVFPVPVDFLQLLIGGKSGPEGPSGSGSAE